MLQLSEGGGRAAALLGPLRRLCAVDVLVEPAGPRARIRSPAPVGVLVPALHDVGAVGFSAFARISAGDDVPPVGPGAVRERPDRADVEVVAAERHRAPAELLPVRVARDVAQPLP